ncbi:MAG: hypothetical protein R3C68_11115 [Myxococcota bacterium]
MDNRVSFSRFNGGLDPDIAKAGMTVDEYRSQIGSPDPNPVVSPMANPRVSDVRLSLSAEGSDKLRLATPVEPNINPYQGPKRLVDLTRSAHSKLQAPVFGDLRQVLRADTGNEIADSARLRLMDNSIVLTEVLSALLGHNLGMHDGVEANRLAVSKG